MTSPIQVLPLKPAPQLMRERDIEAVIRSEIDRAARMAGKHPPYPRGQGTGGRGQ